MAAINGDRVFIRVDSDVDFVAGAVLLARLENGARLRESVSTWLLFRWHTDSQLLSYPLHATIAAFVTSLVIVIPLRRLFDEPVVKPMARLICLPYSLRLAAHLFSLVLKPLAVPIVLYSIAIPALMMAAISTFLSYCQLNREQIPRYRPARMWLHRVLQGRLNPCGAFALYAGTWVITVWLIKSWITPNESPTWFAPTSLVYTVAFPGLLSALVLAAIALWRSLALATHRNFVTENFRTLARIVVVLTLFPTALAGFFLGLPYSGESLSEAVRDSGGPGWSLMVSDNGSAIRISGEIRPGISDALTEVLETSDGVQRLELESPGGSVREGLALAALVEKYSLDTVVKTYCDSACTLVFVAGRERVLETGAELGFHRCRSPLWYHALLYDGENNAQLARYLQSKGVSKPFADKVISVPSDDVWYPSLDQLSADGIITAAATSDAGKDAAP